MSRYEYGWMDKSEKSNIIKSVYSEAGHYSIESRDVIGGGKKGREASPKFEGK